MVSSLLFGLLHVRTPAELPLTLVYASVGAVYGLVLLASRGNLLVAIVAHGIHNGVPALSGAGAG